MYVATYLLHQPASLTLCTRVTQGRKKKPFIDKKKGTTYHLVPRSRADPLLDDPHEPQHVLKPEQVTREKICFVHMYSIISVLLVPLSGGEIRGPPFSPSLRGEIRGPPFSPSQGGDQGPPFSPSVRGEIRAPLPWQYSAKSFL